MKTTTTTTPSLSMKTVNKSTLQVTNSTAAQMTCSSTQFITLSLTPSLANFTSYSSVKLKFAQIGVNNGHFRLYECNSSYIISSKSYPTCTYTENGINYREVDITSAYINSKNEKIYFALCAESSTSLTVYTNNASTTYLPKLTIEKVNDTGIVKYQTAINGYSSSKDLYSVNPRIGELKYSINLLNIESNHLPLNLCLNYDERNINNSIVNGSINTNFPIGWRLNYQQYIYPSGNNYIYVDSNNVKHTFILANNLTASSSNKIYFDQDGTYLTLRIDSNLNYVIKSGNEVEELIFNSSGYLTKISQKVSETKSYFINLNYTNNKLTSIEKENGDKITITYDTTNSKITIKGRTNKKAILTYNSSNLLSSILLPTGEITSFAYTGDNSTFSSRAIVNPVLPPLPSTPVELSNLLLNITTNNKRIDFTYITGFKTIKDVDEVFFDESSDYPETHYGLSYTKLQTRITMTPGSKYNNNGTIITQLTFNEEGELVREHEIDDVVEKNSITYKRNQGLNHTYSDSAASILYYDDRIISLSSLKTETVSPILNVNYNNTTLENDDENYEVVINYYVDRIQSENKNNSYETKISVYEGKKNNSTAYDNQVIDIDKPFSQQVVIPVKTKAIKLELEFSTTNPYVIVNFTSIKIIKKASTKTRLLSNEINNQDFNINNIDNYNLSDISLKYRYNGSNYSNSNTSFEYLDFVINGDNKARYMNSSQTSYNVWANGGKSFYANVTNVFYVKSEEETDILQANILISNETDLYAMIEKISYELNNDVLYNKVISKHIYYKKDKKHKMTSSVIYDLFGNELSKKDDNEFTVTNTIDSNGNITKVTCKNNHQHYDNSDPNNKINHYYVYDKDRVNKVYSKLNNEDIGLQYKYNNDGELLIEQEIKSPCIVRNEFEYLNDNISRITFYPGSVYKSNKFEYNNKNLLKKILREDNDTAVTKDCYEFTYDIRNNLSQVKIFGSLYCDISTTYDNGLVRVTIKYPSGREIKESYDKYGRINKIEKRNSSSEEFIIDKEFSYANLIYIYTDEETYEVPEINDRSSSLVCVFNGDEYISYNTNEYSTPFLKIYQNDSALYTQKIEYTNSGRSRTYIESDHLLEKLSINENLIEEKDSLTNAQFITKDCTIYNMDTDESFYFKNELRNEKLHRGYEENILEYIDISPLIYSKELEFYDGDSSSTTGFISKEKYFNNSTVSNDISYTYNNKGNITSIIKDNKITTYTYDIHDRLTREDNESLNKTFLIEYDEYGNITSKKEYNYNDTSVLLKENTYSYDSSNKILLTKFNGINITYNSDLLPTSYEGKILSWDSNKLTQYGNTQFKYTLDGYRVSKETAVNNKYTSYSIDGSDIIKEKINYNKDIYYISGAQGKIGFVYDGIAYHYRRNILGDIIEIYQQNTLVAKYIYDAWGNHKVLNPDGTENTSTTFIGNINPFRYRGYYYDVETQLFYCNSRYYSPELCRWISPDSIEYLDPTSINGLNLYAYCGNDPVNRFDPTGHAFISILVGLGIAALIGAGIGAASYTAGQLIDYAITGDFEWSWGGFFGSTIGGAVGGMLAYLLPYIGIGSAAVGAFFSGAATNVGTMIGQNITDNAGYSAMDILFSSAITGVFSALSVGVMSRIRIPGLNAGRGSYSAVSSQMYTKFRNQTISRITMRTFGKMLAAEAYSGIAGSIF